MGFAGIITPSAFLIVWINMATLDIAAGETSVEARSEGSDCRCKCILTTADGGPCEGGSLFGGARKTTYQVETISGGADCRCTCHTPPPGGCAGVTQRVEPTLSGGFGVSEGETDESIDLVGLHNTISSMVSAMVKLEKAVLKTSPTKSRALRRNVDKVVSALRSTNGSYADLLKDLDLDVADSGVSPGGKDNDRTSERKATPAIPPLRDVASDPIVGGDWNEFDQLPSHRGVSSPPRNTTVIIPTTSTATASEEAKPTDASTVKAAEPTNATDLPVLTTQGKAGSPGVALGLAEARTTAPVARERLVEPQLLFIPYRAKQPHEAGGPPGQSSNQVQADDYEYDYDEFDVASTEKTTTTTTTTLTTRLTSPITSDAKEVVITPVSAVQHETDTRATKNPAEGEELNTDDSYQYEYEYDYDETSEEPATTAASTTPKPGGYDRCGTLVSIFRPRVVGHFGRREGAWMRDPAPCEADPDRAQRIYVTNFYYGNNLMEFDGVSGLRSLRYANSYNLPHKWIGTGHAVYNGSFYYNRAFSTSLIKYDLRYRFVSAWSSLPHAMYDKRTTLSWKGHSMVHVAADEEGLWVVYPSHDPFDAYAKLNYVVNKINPIDLTVLESYKTKLRRPPSHVFMICGMLYATDGHNSRRGRVTQAFDTRTLAERSFYLGYEQMFSYTVQFSYNPAQRKIYAWDNGRQIEYDVGLVH